MADQDVVKLIKDGRTDLVFEFLALPDWRGRLGEVLPSFVYYNDVTALRAVVAAGGELAPFDLNGELGAAAFYGHWKVCDFLLARGADPRSCGPTGETPLHSALCKAGRPYFIHVVRLLLDHGADPNARTVPGRESDAFMRDVRTRGETPLHRAAAFGTEAVIQLLLERGAERELRDANGDTPLSWASWHLRPASVLALLAYGPHHIGPGHVERYTGDHGQGWGGMEAHVLGDYRPIGR
jgi:ankyrin repeat protein